jgi:thiol-disulfide isomerase/thioredoxin
MKKLFVFFGFVFAFLSSIAAHAELAVGDAAPNPVLTQVMPNGLDSRHETLRPSAAGEFVLLDFFSVTCGFCVRDLPKIADFAREIVGRATVRVVGVDRDEQRMRKFRNENLASFPYDFALDSSRAAMRAYGVTGTPTYFLVDSRGQIVFVKLGALDANDLDRIRDIIGAPRN